jgi:hypothetical protein
MTVVSYSLPSGGVLQYTNDMVPRLGEHVSFRDTIYVVTEVRHFPATNSAWINLRNTQ